MNHNKVTRLFWDKKAHWSRKDAQIVAQPIFCKINTWPFCKKAQNQNKLPM
jgi:hypothetical protein